MKIISPAYEDLIMKAKESIFKGKVITAKDYDLDNFKNFIELLTHLMQSTTFGMMEC